MPELVPIRYGRMLVSPFTFYRGAAALMAADLAGAPRTGLHVQLCGDAHLSNFGAFAAPDRRLVFGVNDFDETLPGPFEWDVKRLVGELRGRRPRPRLRRQAARARSLAAARAYREAMREFAEMRDARRLVRPRSTSTSCAERWAAQASAKQLKRFERNVAKARAKDSLRAFDKLTDDRRRRAADRQRPAADRADRGARRRRRSATQLEDAIRDADPLLPAHAAERPPPPARALPLRRTPRARSSASAASARAPGSC